MSEYRIELVRSDLGDGGWSLHAHRTDTSDDEAWPILLTGRSPAVDGEWVRPDEADWTHADEAVHTLAETMPLERA